jgi:hypothetical protein
MGAAYPRRLLALPGDDADALVNLARNILRSASLQKRDATRPARGQHGKLAGQILTRQWHD